MPKTSTAEHFFEKAEQCFRRSRGERKIAVELDAMGNEFMAKAIELDTKQQKLARGAQPAPSGGPSPVSQYFAI